MGHVYFNPDIVNWAPYFAAQHGGSYFQGVPYQRGYGIGSVFASSYRFLAPWLKELGKEGLALGARFLGDMVQGKNAKESLVTESKAGLKNLLQKGAEKLQEGSGRRKRKSKTVKSINRKRIVGRTVKRKPLSKIDIFGLEK